MKAGGGPQHSSFGIPQQLQDAHTRARTEAEKNREKETAQPSPPAPEGFAPPPPPKEPGKDEPPQDFELNTENAVKYPEKTLERLGAKFDAEDYHRLLFKGYYETTLVMAKKWLPVVDKDFTVTFRTLNGRQYDEADEMLADEVQGKNMTSLGADLRRATIHTAFGIMKFHNNDICKDVKVEGTDHVDTKATAAAKRKVLLELSPALSNKIIDTHRLICAAINAILKDQSSYLKNS